MNFSIMGEMAGICRLDSNWTAVLE